MPRATRNRLLVHCENVAYKARAGKNGQAVEQGVRLGIKVIQPVPTGKYPLAYLAKAKRAIEQEMERVTGQPDGEPLREGLNLVLWEIEREASTIDRA